MNYAKRKQQLDHILKDKVYWKFRHDGFKSFVVDMRRIISMGYGVSEKQEEAITNAVSNYAKYFLRTNDPKYEKKTHDMIKKVKSIEDIVYASNHSLGSISLATKFLSGIEKYIKSGNTLTTKQKTALNNLHTRFKENL